MFGSVVHHVYDSIDSDVKSPTYFLMPSTYIHITQEYSNEQLGGSLGHSEISHLLDHMYQVFLKFMLFGNRIRSRVPIILHLHVRVFIWSNWTLGALLITRMMGELLIATHAQPLQNSSCSHCSLFPALRQDYSFYVSHCWSRLKTLGSRTQVRPDGWNSATAYIYHELSFHQLALHTLQVPVFTNHARESQFTKQGDVAYLRIWQIDH